MITCDVSVGLFSSSGNKNEIDFVSFHHLIWNLGISETSWFLITFVLRLFQLSWRFTDFESIVHYENVDTKVNTKGFQLPPRYLWGFLLLCINHITLVILGTRQNKAIGYVNLYKSIFFCIISNIRNVLV